MTLIPGSLAYDFMVPPEKAPDLTAFALKFDFDRDAPRVLTGGGGPRLVCAFLDIDWRDDGTDVRSGLWRLNIAAEEQGRGYGRFAVTEVAFNEDKTLIEAQQKLIDLDPTRTMLPTSLDAGPTQFRKMVDTLAR